VWNEGDVIHPGPDEPGWRILQVAPVPNYTIYSGLLVVEPTERR
jgi:hypothetical protein